MTQEPLFPGFELNEKPKREKPFQPMEPILPGWKQIRNGNGVLPFSHLIQSQSSNGAVVTRCHRTGQLLPTEGVVVMLRCPGCDMDLQLSE